MNKPADLSLIDLSLRARHLRSVYLADLFRRALARLGGTSGNAPAEPRDADVALERH